MAELFDFERYWQNKFCRCLDDALGEENRRFVTRGGESLTSKSGDGAIIAWSRQAMARLSTVADIEQQRAIMLGCACQYPNEELSHIRARFAAGGDLSEVNAMLQEQFEAFLRVDLHLDEEMVAAVTERGWGLAGTLENGTIIATKIPKSGNLRAYLAEADPDRRRELYCHCPRVRAVIRTSESLPPVYCYCGAGFYRGIWEEILQHPVQIEVLETVIQGGEECRFRIKPAPAAAGAAHVG
jgi:hypothetical protein